MIKKLRSAGCGVAAFAVESRAPQLGLDSASRSFRIRGDLLTVAGIAVAYFIAGKVGLRLAIVHPSATAVWAPSGIALAGFLLLGSRVWPGVFLGALLVNATTYGTVETSLAIAAGNTLEGFIGASLLQRFANGPNVFDRLRDTIKFPVLAAFGSTTIAATIGVVSLCIGGSASWPAFWWIWLTWWLGDAAGTLIVTPLIVLWVKEPWPRWNRRAIEELALLYLSLAILGGALWGGWIPLAGERYPIGLVWMSIALWAAFRFGPRETATATFALCAIALIGTLQGNGPFAQASRNGNEALLLLQTYLGLFGMLSLAAAIELAERRRLNQVHARLAAIVDSSDDAIVAQTLQGIITSWNASAERIFGYSAEEAIGQHIGIIIPHDRLKETTESLARVARGEAIRSFETRRLRKGGQTIDISLSMSPIFGDDGQIIGASRISRDISEQKRIQTQLFAVERAARQAAEDANRSKDEFLAMLGHELRNPVAALSAAAHVLERAGEKQDIAKKAQGIIVRQVDQLSRLMDDLLEVARVTLGKITLYPRPMNLADCVIECVNTMTQGVDSNRIRVEGHGAWVNGDRERLSQVVTNLLSNAINHTPKSGSVVISIENEANAAIIRVKDNGVGIEPELLPQIFDLFVQGKPGLDRSGSGLGIGLTLVKRLVELHGGKVEVRSDGPGKGSCFTVRLPSIVAPAEVSAEVVGAAHEVAASRRILIVEDNEDIRSGLRALLESSGHQVYEASDGPSGVNTAVTTKPDVALIDVGLPVLDGYEVARRIRSSVACNETRLIALTGYSQAEYRKKAMQAGFEAYLVKPVRTEQLTDLIVRLSVRPTV